MFVCLFNVEFFCKAASNVGPMGLSGKLPLCITIVDIMCMFINLANKDACLLA